MKDGHSNKKHRKKARKALLLFLRKLRKSCSSFNKADEWYKFLKENLDPVLKEFSPDLSEEARKKIEDGRKLIDTTRDGISRSCKNLGKNVEYVIKSLPKSGGLLSGIVGTFIFGAVAIGAAAVILNTIAVPVVINNRGCGTLYPTVYLPFKIPGLSLPDKPIVNGESATAKIPPVTFTVNGSGNKINLQAFGMNLNFDLGGNASDLIYNGRSLLDTTTTINLKDRPAHSLTVSCN